MPARPERILLLRSGRHLSVAIDVLRRAYPGCHVRAIVTPGTEAALANEGIGPADYFIYDARPQFDAWPLVTSGLYFRALGRGYDRVAVLWLDPDGSARANVDRTALLLSPAGFDAITPDGQLLHRRAWTMAAREARRAILSLATLACLGALLYGPARIARLLKGDGSGAGFCHQTRPPGNPGNP